MKIVIRFIGLLVLCIGFELSVRAQDIATERPNILFILADDLGMEGISSYGGDLHQTPNIDQIGKEGVLFKRAFANPYCTPTRSEILTGRYPFATNTSRVISDYDRHKNMVLDVSQPTFAKQFQKAGYKTAIAGKWQLTFISQNDQIHEFGFDTYMVWQIQTKDKIRTTRYHNPYFRSDGKIIHEEIKDRYGPDVMVDFLIDFMSTNHKSGKPFMAYYTSMLPHFPFVPTPDSEDQTIPESAKGPGVVHGDQKFYPDMVHRLDYNVGRLLDKLDELGISQNTIVIFVADNGTDQHLTSSINGYPLQGGKGTLTDRATRVPMMIRWPGKIQPGSIDEELVKVADFFPTLCEMADVPFPSQPIHGQSFSERISGKGAKVEPREWVHIQRADDRYLRTKEWIVTDKGEFKKVQPYPNDAVKVEDSTLDRKTKKELHQLKKELDSMLIDRPDDK